MLIDKNLIEEAKEKLGDENMTLMADILELDGFDERKKSALSPFRQEDTNSFCYDSKTYRFRDFGGDNKTVDIIDALIYKGYTFVDAVKYLFDKADIDYSFAENGKQTKRNYRYPHEEPLNDKVHTYEYLAQRGISKETADYLDIREDARGNMVFNYYDTNNILTMVKYRPSHKIDKASKENKNWCQKDADTTPILFNCNRINPNQPLVITEGELDTASVIEAGYQNCVSIPLGCGNYHWVSEMSEWLEDFDEIIICFDNDEPGVKARKEIINMLGSWRCKYVEIPKELEFQHSGRIVPVKDCNEVLQAESKEFLCNLILNAKETPLTSVAQMSDIEELNIYDMEGFKSGIAPLDKEYYKLFTKNVTVITGSAGAGKSTLLNEIALNSMDSGYNVLLISFELMNGFASAWLDKVAAGVGNIKTITTRDGDVFPVVTDEAKKGIRKFYNDKFYIYKDDAGNEEDVIFEHMEECVRKRAIRTIFIDNLMTVLLNEDVEGANKAQTKFMSRLIQFANKYDVSIFLVCHLRKLMSGTTDAGLSDVSGSSNLTNLAHRTLSLRRVKQSEKENPQSKYHGYDLVITSLKDRITGFLGEIPLYYDKPSHRIYSSEAEYSKNYLWDNNHNNSGLKPKNATNQELPE